MTSSSNDVWAQTRTTQKDFPRVDDSTLPSLCDAVRTDGFAIVKNMLTPELCARLRDCADRIFGEQQEGTYPKDLNVSFDVDLALQTRAPDRRESGNYRHAARHPIFDGVMAEAVTAGNMVDMQRALLRSDRGLRLMQQQLVRSDPDPKAIASGSTPNGWHMDTAFLPKHYDSVPQMNVHHVVTCLNKVESGGAAFMVVPGSFRFAKEYTRSMPLAEQEALRDSDFRTKLRPELLSRIDTSPGVELLMDEGDACVFDQMTVHSASPQSIPHTSRYVLFSTFFDISAAYALLPERGASVAPRKFPAEFRATLPSHLHYLLDWQHPEDRGANPHGSWGMAENKVRLAQGAAHAAGAGPKL